MCSECREGGTGLPSPSTITKSVSLLLCCRNRLCGGSSPSSTTRMVAGKFCLRRASLDSIDLAGLGADELLAYMFSPCVILLLVATRNGCPQFFKCAEWMTSNTWRGRSFSRTLSRQFADGGVEDVLVNCSGEAPRQKKSPDILRWGASFIALQIRPDQRGPRDFVAFSAKPFSNLLAMASARARCSDCSGQSPSRTDS